MLRRTLAAAAKPAGIQAAEAGTFEAKTGAGRMLAWRLHNYGSLEELKLEEARVPPIRAPDEVLVRVHYSSVNPLDVAMIGGYGSCLLNSLRRLEGADVEFPLVPGRDLSGEVVRAGASTRLRRGDRVWAVVPPHRSGAHAQYVVVKEKWAGIAPKNLSGAEAGGALYAALSAAAALRAAGASPGERAGAGRRVLLLGLGGVGHAALQILVHDNFHVVVGCTGELCQRAESLGAAHALDRHAPDYDELLVQHGPYEAIIDCAGLGGGEAGARRWRFARYVTLTSPLLRETDARGAAPGALSAAATLAAHSLAAARAALSPASASLSPASASLSPASASLSPAHAPAALCPPPHVRWAFFQPDESTVRLLTTMAERGQFKVEVERQWAWLEAREALSKAAQGGARGKLLLDFTAPATC